MSTEDRIYLRGLKCQCIIGFIDWERQVPQTVVLDLEFPCDCARAAASDSVAETIDYKQVAKRVLAFVEGSRNFFSLRPWHIVWRCCSSRSSGSIGCKIDLGKPGPYAIRAMSASASRGAVADTWPAELN